MSIKDERTVSLLREMAAEFFKREPVSKALLTVTRVTLSTDRGLATIYFTVFPDSSEQETLKASLRKRSDFRDFVEKNSKLGKIPFFEFAVDLGEKNRQKIDNLSQQK